MNLSKNLTALCAVALMAAPLASFADSSSDRAIERDAKKNMPNNIADKVSISSQDGIVTLTGTLYTSSQRDIAVSAVKQVPQVRNVEDEIKVDDGHGNVNVVSTGPAPITNGDDQGSATDKTTTEHHHSDKWIALKVKSELVVHKNVSASHTDVNVVEGVVTLSGFAKSEAQKELTEQYAKSVDGVRDVKNEIEVRDDSTPVSTTTTAPRSTFAGDSGYTTGDKIDDSTITTKVKFQLAKHKSTSAFHTEVHTTNGVVYISGNATNSAEKDLVTQLATGVAGVSSVKNDMTVQENP